MPCDSVPLNRHREVTSGDEVVYGFSATTLPFFQKYTGVEVAGKTLRETSGGRHVKVAGHTVAAIGMFKTKTAPILMSIREDERGDYFSSNGRNLSFAGR
jgi:hypothetical protein